MHNMPPVSRGTKPKPGASSRRPATPPAQQRRTAAAQPTNRRTAAAVEEPAEEEEETTPFDASAAGDDQGEEEYDEDNLPEIIDMSGVQAASFSIVPRGRYQGYINSVEYGLSQSSSQPMLTWELKFDYEDKERTLRFYTTLTGDGAPRSKATISRLNPEIDFATFAPDDADEMFGGMDVIIAVAVGPDREDRKLKRNNVRDIYPLDEE